MDRFRRVGGVAAAGVLVISSFLAVGAPAVSAQPGGFCGFSPAVVGLRPGQSASYYLQAFPDPWSPWAAIAFNGVFNPSFTQLAVLSEGEETVSYDELLSVLRQGLGDESATTGALTFRYSETQNGPRACEVTFVLWDEVPPSPTPTPTPTPTTAPLPPAPTPEVPAVTPRFTG
jgi:hypothetical protein